MNTQRPPENDDTIIVKLSCVDTLILADTIARYVRELEKEPSLFNLCKSTSLKGILDQLLVQAVDKSAQELKQHATIFDALKREREKK